MHKTLNHFAPPSFWKCYDRLPETVRAIADKNFELLKSDPNHPSLHLKKVGRYWSVRAGISYRALGIGTPDGTGIVWFWLGSHAEYDKLIG